ncbi:MAG: LPS export ABC transporter periplasmic protein LptC [Moraxella sp.]|nr:LPS export ABC transporter periplasmic protein LptC [Moraxella sp.]
MNIKILSVVAVVLLVGALWFYNTHQDDSPAVALAKPDISSEVTEIKAVQTNAETGETEYMLTAKSLVQNQATGQDEMLDAVMDWQPPNGESYTITTAKAVLNQATGELVFSAGFVLTRKATEDKPEMVMQGSQLLGNTKTYKVWSDEALDIKQGDDNFTAEAMQADLAAGEYEFSRIAIEFTAPERVDKTLF